ncbi:MAG: hypothetical protein JXR77_19525 [Lentisphaeria bacterium]|nr:hypothetical protein [Lentisphaeria bacterium]
MNRCFSALAFSLAQREHLRRAIDEDKWYLSEAAGRDVGWQVALEHFSQYHLHRVAAEFRLTFCTHECPSRGNCDLCERILEMNSHWAGRVGQR